MRAARGRAAGQVPLEQIHLLTCHARLFFQVPLEQIHLLNFDEWTAEPAKAMDKVGAFLQLAPFQYQISQAHNTHLSRSVHVQKQGASDLGDVAFDSVEAGMSFGTHCILHEFYRPYLDELDALMRAHGLPLMQWDTAHKGDRVCPSTYKHWPLALMANRRKGAGAFRT